MHNPNPNPNSNANPNPNPNLRRWWLRDLRLTNANETGGKHRLVDNAQIPPGAGSDDSAASAASLAGARASWAPLPLSWTRPSRGTHGG